MLHTIKARSKSGKQQLLIGHARATVRLSDDLGMKCQDRAVRSVSLLNSSITGFAMEP